MATRVKAPEHPTVIAKNRIVQLNALGERRTPSQTSELLSLLAKGLVSITDQAHSERIPDRRAMNPPTPPEP